LGDNVEILALFLFSGQVKKDKASKKPLTGTFTSFLPVGGLAIDSNQIPGLFY